MGKVKEPFSIRIYLLCPSADLPFPEIMSVYGLVDSDVGAGLGAEGCAMFIFGQMLNGVSWVGLPIKFGLWRELYTYHAYRAVPEIPMTLSTVHRSIGGHLVMALSLPCEAKPYSVIVIHKAL